MQDLADLLEQCLANDTSSTQLEFNIEGLELIVDINFFIGECEKTN